jgi:hypothetical protein
VGLIARDGSYVTQAPLLTTPGAVSSAWMLASDIALLAPTAPGTATSPSSLTLLQVAANAILVISGAKEPHEVGYCFWGKCGRIDHQTKQGA